MPSAEVVCEILFEVLNLGSEDIAAVAENAEGRLADSLIDLRAESAQVKKRNGHRMLS
jgi:hypothetical protein